MHKLYNTCNTCSTVRAVQDIGALVQCYTSWQHTTEKSKSVFYLFVCSWNNGCMPWMLQ